jgi:hypothetical protein
MSSMSNSALMVGAIFAMRYINFQNPKMVMYVKLAYITMQLVALLVLLFIRKRISSNKETQPVTIPESRSAAAQTMSVKDYDLSQWKQGLSQALVGTCITLFINYKWQAIQPLFIQSLLTPKNMITSPLFRIYITGEKAVGKLSRPFKTDNPLMDLFKHIQQPAQEAPRQAEAVVDDTIPREGSSTSTEPKNRY